MPTAKSSRSTQRDRVAARGGVERDAGAGDAAADHDHVEVLVRRSPRAPSARRSISLVEELDDLVGRAARSGGRLLLALGGRGGAGRRSARSSGSPTAARPSAVRSTLGRAPVAGEPAARGRRAGRCRRRTAVACRSSSSWTGSPVERAGADDQGRARGRASRPPPGPAASLSRSSACGPITRKRQGLVRLWLGAQRASSSSSSSVLAVHRLGPEGLVGAAGADRVLDVHRGNVVERPLAGSGKAAPVEDPAAPGRSAASQPPRPATPTSQPREAASARRPPAWTEAGAQGHRGVGWAADGARRRRRRGRALRPSSRPSALAVPRRRSGGADRLGGARRRRCSEPPSADGPRHRRRAGSGLPLTASRACPVTQTGVWSLEAE